MTTEELVDRLAAHRTIGKAPREELIWIATHGTLCRFKAGEVVARHTEVVDGLYILLTGRLSISVNRGNKMRKVMEWQGGDVTGILPYSRMTTPPGDTVVEETAEAVGLTRKDLPELVRNCYEVTSAMVHVMTDRARRFTTADLRDEKMISLGKLAAGLAHELNNPASAAMRDAKSMASILTTVEETARALGTAHLSESQRAELGRVQHLCLDAGMQRALSGLALADREEEIAGWLAARGIGESIAEDLAKTPVTVDVLERLAGALDGKNLATALRWIAADCAARSVAIDIERAATRIHGLVTAVKGFTHMDRDPDVGPVVISSGLSDTVALLAGKAKSKSVEINLDIAKDLPAVFGLNAEINQIWMNLVDNAIDAAPVNGHVTVRASHEGPRVVVRVLDDGPGISADIRESIFDPFFTTKSVGEGTGLGLDIVRRIIEWHNGEIEVSSAPGRTEFRVSLPAFHS
jgi:signal transduction histidine kinase